MIRLETVESVDCTVAASYEEETSYDGAEGNDAFVADSSLALLAAGLRSQDED